jgi:hypothetical protein
MSRNTVSSGASRRTFAWPLELEVELCDANRCRVTGERLSWLAALLNGAEGVSLAAVETHGQANLVRVYVSVDAEDPYDAHDRACAAVHEHVSRAGLGPAILVASRPAARRVVGRM